MYDLFQIAHLTLGLGRVQTRPYFFCQPQPVRNAVVFREGARHLQHSSITRQYPHVNPRDIHSLLTPMGIWRLYTTEMSQLTLYQPLR